MVWDEKDEEDVCYIIFKRIYNALLMVKVENFKHFWQSISMLFQTYKYIYSSEPQALFQWDMLTFSPIYAAVCDGKYMHVLA